MDPIMGIGTAKIIVITLNIIINISIRQVI